MRQACRSKFRCTTRRIRDPVADVAVAHDPTHSESYDFFVRFFLCFLALTAFTLTIGSQEILVSMMFP